MWSRPAPVPFQYSYWRSLRIPGTSKYEWPPGQMYCRLWDIYSKLSWPQFWSHFQSFIISGHSMNLKTWLIVDCPWFNCSSFVASFFPFYLFIYFFHVSSVALSRCSALVPRVSFFFFAANNPARTREFSEGRKNARVEREEKRGCTWALRVQRAFRQSEEIISAVNKLFWYCKVISWILSISLRGLSFDVWY